MLCDAPGGPITQQRIDECVNALIDEGRTLQRLAAVLDSQRAGVSANDPRAIEESVHAMGRILLTTDEARRRRRALLALSGAPEDLPLSALESVFGDPLPESLATARQSVWATAMAVRREVAINHRIISRALQAGDSFLRRLFAETADQPSVYRSESAGHAPEPAGGVIVNRQA